MTDTRSITLSYLQFKIYHEENKRSQVRLLLSIYFELFYIIFSRESPGFSCIKSFLFADSVSNQ